MLMNDDRRRYFRVNDRIAMRFLRVRDDCLSSPELMLLSVASRLESVERNLQKELNALKDIQPRLVAVLELLDRKLNLVLESQDLHANARQPGLLLADVNLSASGIAFPADQVMDIGERLLLELVFYPEEDHLKVMAHAISCAPAESGYWVRADFDNLSESEQELLVQHVLRCQTRELRARREARERGDSVD